MSAPNSLPLKTGRAVLSPPNYGALKNTVAASRIVTQILASKIARMTDIIATGIEPSSAWNKLKTM